MIYARIAGVGSYLPENIVSNKDLEKTIDTSDEWIRDRTGIERRHIVADDETTSSISVIAAERAMQAAGVSAEDIDLILVGTTTPDKVFPSTACIIQRKLGIKGVPAMDLQAACSGFVYGLDVANRFIKTGGAKTVLVIGAETLSRIPIGKIEAQPCCSVMVRAARCCKRVTSRALSPRIYTPMASMKNCYTFEVVCR